jgi:transposase-like protein
MVFNHEEIASNHLAVVLQQLSDLPYAVSCAGRRLPQLVASLLSSRLSQHYPSRYLNNRLEQDHRGIKQRYYPMLGFESFDAASLFCRAFDEQGDYSRYRNQPMQKVSLCEQRQMFRRRFGALQISLLAV